jgi:hypothetical protein
MMPRRRVENYMSIKKGRIARYKGDGPFLFWGSAHQRNSKFLISINRVKNSVNIGQRHPGYPVQFWEG